jgi:hypothetical protein
VLFLGLWSKESHHIVQGVASDAGDNWKGSRMRRMAGLRKNAWFLPFWQLYTCRKMIRVETVTVILYQTRSCRLPKQKDALAGTQRMRNEVGIGFAVGSVADERTMGRDIPGGFVTACRRFRPGARISKNSA